MLPMNGETNRGKISESLGIAVLLALSGGFQDAYTFLCRDGVFANAQTGNIVLMSAHLFRGEWAAAGRYVIPLSAYLLGTAAAEVIFFRFEKSRNLHWKQWVLLAEIVGLAAVGWMPDGLNPIANALVSFVCAMQVQAFHTMHGQSYASTMCIGNLRSGAEALCRYARTGKRSFLRTAGIYGTVVLFFALGAGIGSVLTEIWGLKSIWVCPLFLFAAFGLLFMEEQEKK